MVTAVTAACSMLPSSTSALNTSSVPENDSQQQGTSNYVIPELPRLPFCVVHVSADVIWRIKEVEFVDLASLLSSRAVSSEPPAKRFRVKENSGAAVNISTVMTPRRRIESFRIGLKHDPYLA